VRGAGTRRQISEPTVRVGGTLAIVEVLRDFGIDPAEALTVAGIQPGLLDDPDNLITYRARGRLMAGCAARTACPHFGLLVGQRMNLQALGLVGLLARSSPDVRTALRSIVNYLHLHARGAVMGIEVDRSLAILSYNAYQPGVEGADHVGDAAVAMMLNVMRTLCGPRFVPIEARFAHRKPDDVRPFRRFFEVPVRFDAEGHALVFSSDWLRESVPGSDAEMQRLLKKQIDALEARNVDAFPDSVRSVLRSALLTGHASAGEIAALFAIHPRTLSRRLEDFGTSFQELVDEGRFDIARGMLEHAALDVTQIADSLGYTRASAFIRAFRRWSGTTPTQWRAGRSRRP
jgi:AraC-like DNA-binding protein